MGPPVHPLDDRFDQIDFKNRQDWAEHLFLHDWRVRPCRTLPIARPAIEALPLSAQTSAKSRVKPALNADLEPRGRPFGLPDCPGCQGFKLDCVRIVSHC